MDSHEGILFLKVLSKEKHCANPNKYLPFSSAFSDTKQRWNKTETDKEKRSRMRKIERGKTEYWNREIGYV